MRHRCALVVLLASTAAAERANLCFTANAKTALQCTKPLAAGPISVYDSSESPQRARKLFFKANKLCKNKHCKECLAADRSFVACGTAPKFSAFVMGANGVPAQSHAIFFALVVVAVPLVIFRFGTTSVGTKSDATAAARPVGGDKSAVGFAAGVVAFLLRFASSWWFPFVAGAGTAINMFTIIFTGATVVLFLSAVLGQPRRWWLSALINAAGATVGTAVLLFLVRERGMEYLTSSFPALIASPAWAKATGLSARPHGHGRAAWAWRMAHGAWVCGMRRAAWGRCHKARPHAPPLVDVAPRDAATVK